MTDFVNNGASELPPVKSDARAPTGALTEWKADDTNRIRQALLDLRAEAINLQGQINSLVISGGGGIVAQEDGVTVGATGIVNWKSGVDVSLSSGVASLTNTITTNVRDYGATGDGTTDDQAAIQAAIDAAASKQVTGGHRDYGWRTPGPPSSIVYFPSGYYRVGSPLRVQNDGIWLVGEGTNSSRIQALTPGSAALIVSRPWASSGSNVNIAPTFTASLATGSGYSQYIAGGLNDNNTADIRMLGMAELNGLSAFCIEFFVKFTTIANGHGTQTIMSSGGGFGTTASQASFTVNIRESDSRIYATLRVSGVNYGIASTNTFGIGTTYHVALTFDGATIRLFVDGTLEGSQAAAGTITQSGLENVYFGTQPSGWGPSGQATFPFNGSIDSIRLSNAARYTIGFAKPTAKFSYDASTMALQNFDVTLEEGGLQTWVNASGQRIWAPCVLSTFTSLVRGGGLRNIAFGSPIYGKGNYRWDMDNVELWPSYGDVAYWAENNFTAHHRRVSVNGTGYGFLFHSACGVTHLDSCDFNGLKVQLAIVSSSVKLSNVYFAVNSTSTAALTVSTPASVAAESCAFSVETPVTPSVYLGHILLSGLEYSQFTACRFETDNLPRLISATTCNAIKISAGSLSGSTTMTEIAEVVTPYTYGPAVIFDDCSFNIPIGTPLSLSSYATVVAHGCYDLGSVTTAPTFNARRASTFKMALGADIASSTMNGLAPGQKISFIISQDAVGGRTFVWPLNVLGGGTPSTMSLTTSTQDFVSDGTFLYPVSTMTTGLQYHVETDTAKASDLYATAVA